MKRRSLIASLCICVFAALAPSPTAGAARPQGEEGRKEVYTGTLVGIGGAAGGRTATFTLTITGHATRDQTLAYAELLRSKGQDALLDQLRDREMGTFALTGQTGRRVNFVFETPTAEGRRVTVIFERWLQMFELRYGTRSQDYPFSYMEFSIDKNGRGGGTMIGAAKIYFDKDDASTVNVENFGTYPLRVVDVRLRK
jgi:hypothetical protein